MAKSNQIQKLVNGEIADADDVNQIVEDAGTEGGAIPYDPDTEERSTDGSQSLGSAAYPWGSLKINQDAELVEVDKDSHTEASSVAFKNLRKFISQKDTPASYGGAAAKFVAVNAGESAVEFVTSPNKSNLLHSALNGITALNVVGTSYQTVLSTRVLKIPGVTTAIVHVYIYQSESVGTMRAAAKVDIGGANNEVLGTSQNTTGEWKTFNVDISGLSDGTVYDMILQLKHNDDGGGTAYCKNIIVFGS